MSKDKDFDGLYHPNCPSSGDWLKEALERVAEEQLEKSKNIEPEFVEVDPAKEGDEETVLIVDVGILDVPKWEGDDEV